MNDFQEWFNRFWRKCAQEVFKGLAILFGFALFFLILNLGSVFRFLKRQWDLKSAWAMDHWETLLGGIVVITVAFVLLFPVQSYMVARRQRKQYAASTRGQIEAELRTARLARDEAAEHLYDLIQDYKNRKGFVREWEQSDRRKFRSGFSRWTDGQISKYKIYNSKVAGRVRRAQKHMKELEHQVAEIEQRLWVYDQSISTMSSEEINDSYDEIERRGEWAKNYEDSARAQDINERLQEELDMTNGYYDSSTEDNETDEFDLNDFSGWEKQRSNYQGRYNEFD